MDSHFTQRTIKIGEILRARSELLATAESCSGGWVAKVCTDIPGSSDWFDAGFITYSNRAKQTMLGVSPVTLDVYGAVSEQTVLEMAQGALRHSDASWAVAISGIAGPGGGSPDKPVGSVWFACAGPQCLEAQRQQFAGDRDAVRRQSVAYVLDMLLQQLQALDNPQ